MKETTLKPMVGGLTSGNSNALTQERNPENLDGSAYLNLSNDLAYASGPQTAGPKGRSGSHGGSNPRRGSSATLVSNIGLLIGRLQITGYSSGTSLLRGGRRRDSQASNWWVSGPAGSGPASRFLEHDAGCK